MLEIIGLSKHFGDVRAVNDLNLTVNRGEIFTMLGANGAGKNDHPHGRSRIHRTYGGHS